MFVCRRATAWALRWPCALSEHENPGHGGRDKQDRVHQGNRLETEVVDEQLVPRMTKK